MDLLAPRQGVAADTPATKAKKLKQATNQADIKHDQLRLDLGQLTTSITAHNWTRSNAQTIIMGMKSGSTRRDQHATIPKKLIEVIGLAKLHGLNYYTQD